MDARSSRFWRRDGTMSRSGGWGAADVPRGYAAKVLGGYSGCAGLPGRTFGLVAQAFGGRDSDQDGLGFDQLVEGGTGVLVPRQFGMQARRRRVDAVEIGRAHV